MSSRCGCALPNSVRVSLNISSSSRLDRLLVLLDSGSSPAIREAAARQIAQFAAKNVAKDAGADIVLQDGPSASTSTAVWQGTSSEWTDVMAVVGKVLFNISHIPDKYPH